MKTIILNSKKEQEDIAQYGSDLFETLKKESQVLVYDNALPDFSNVPELFDESEKLILFNQYSQKTGFASLTQSLPSFKNVKYILSPYSGYNGLDLALVKSLGIRYRNNGGANAKSVSQYALSCMFMLITKFPILSKLKSIPDGSILAEEYHQKTAGIIGMGNVGQEILQSLNGLGVRTVYFNRTKKNVNADLVSLKDIFKQDVVFISIAANSETTKLLEDITNLCQRHNYIIDITAVDDLYKKNKVLELLNAEKIKGYAVEFFNTVPLDFSSEYNLIVTPHIAWCTSDAEKRKIRNFLNRALLVIRNKASEVDFTV